MSDAFTRLIAASLRGEDFTLVDVGCSGGVEAAWRAFGERFRGIGFDASVSECRRLAELETNPKVRYVPGFVDVPADHPFAARASKDDWLAGKSLFDRSSAGWSVELREKRLAAAAESEKFKHNLWQNTELADPDKPVSAPRVLAEQGYDAVDFLKIDVDGPDFRILNSFDRLFDTTAILGVRLEVSLVGGADGASNTFHNTDRFMREHGYALFRLDNRTYSMRALPARFVYDMPAQTVNGRIFQAEAHYMRDLAASEQRDYVASLSDDKLLKALAILSVWDLPDSAAEILLAYRERLAKVLDVDAALDLLAAQSQPGSPAPLSYRDYMALFAADSPQFFTPPMAPRPTLGQRISAAWHALSDRTYIASFNKGLKKRA
ncbi:MAG: FkbM family methyltransferase [Proteobacteria bacterium]|nr:FkbM family methyltransferase [Pseudomonadota bacterium]